IADSEKDVKELKDIDNSTKVISTIQSEVPKAVKEYLGSSLDDDMYKVIQKNVADIIKEYSVLAKTIERLRQKGNQMMLIRMKALLLDQTEEKTVFEAGDTQGPPNLGEDMGNTDEPPVVNVDPKDWFKKLERPPISDPEWHKGLAYNILKGTCRSYVELDYNMEECYKALIDQLDWNNPECDRYPFDLSKPLPLIMSGNHQIIPVDYFFNNDLAYLTDSSTSKVMSLCTWLTYVHKKYRDPEESGRPSTWCRKLPELGRNRLMCSHELHKFIDCTLISLRDTLKDMSNNLEMGYTSVMPRRRWSTLDKKRSRIMIKDIDC
ncbi:hypothetical protein Tco_0883027, partial [Tanacetum coccineum]